MVCGIGCTALIAVIIGLQFALGSTCPSSAWVENGSFCYLFRTNTGLEWGEARSDCKQRGGPSADLVSITSDEENQFVYSKMKAQRRDFWIGMKKKKAGTPYLWVDGTPVTFTDWDNYQPSDPSGDSRNCVAVYDYSTKWWDYSCYRALPYVCKVPNTYRTNGKYQ